MCGRYTNQLTWAEMVRLYRITESQTPNTWQPRYNIAPTQVAPIVRIAPDTNDRQLELFRWSLVPSWSQGPDSRYSMINARAETVREKPAYRTAFKSRRCLVPASGFYEWQKVEDDGKQPHHIGLASGAPFAFAGLWEHWEPKDDRDSIDSFTIIVTEANDKLQPIHERMPVILEPGSYDTWLNGSPDDAAALLRPFPAEAMATYRISTRVNKPANDDPSIIEPLEASR